MELKRTTESLAALAQETRLRVFRVLVRAGETGLPAGRIATELAVNATTLSRHLAVMESAGLLQSERRVRQIIYRVNFPAVQGLFAFLLEDCCAGEVRVSGKCCEGAEDLKP